MSYLAITIYFLSAILKAAIVTDVPDEGLGHYSRSSSLFHVYFYPYEF